MNTSTVMLQQLIWSPRWLLTDGQGSCTVWMHRTKGWFRSQVKKVSRFIMLFRTCNLKFMSCAPLEIFHLIFLDCSWLWMTETTESKTADNGGHYCVVLSEGTNRSDQNLLTSPVVVFVVVFLLLPFYFFCYIRRNLCTYRKLFLRFHLYTVFKKYLNLKHPIFSLAIICCNAPLNQFWVFTMIVKAHFSYSLQVLTEENLLSNKYGVLNILLLLKKILHLERYVFSASISPTLIQAWFNSLILSLKINTL